MKRNSKVVRYLLIIGLLGAFILAGSVYLPIIKGEKKINRINAIVYMEEDYTNYESIKYTAWKSNILYRGFNDKKQNWSDSNVNMKSMKYMPINTVLYVYGENKAFYKVKIQNEYGYWYISKDLVSDEVCEDMDYSDCYVYEFARENVFIDGIVTREGIDNLLKDYIDKLPQKALDLYQGTITFSTSSIDVATQNRHKLDDTVGLYEDNSQDITVILPYADTFFHEFGHFIGNELGYDNDDFSQIFKFEAKNSDFGKYWESSEREYFAESVLAYLSGDKYFEENCPITYSYIEYVINELS